MALDPAVLKARIDLRICELRLLAAWTATNWRGRAERERLPRGPTANSACVSTSMRSSDNRATAELLIATIEAANVIRKNQCILSLQSSEHNDSFCLYEEISPDVMGIT